MRINCVSQIEGFQENVEIMKAEAERIADDIAADVLGATRGLVVPCR
jgi:hypothetical protein